MPIEQRSNSTSRSSFDPTDETINNAVSTIEKRDLESIIDSNTNKEELDTAIAGVGGGGGGTTFATDAEALAGTVTDKSLAPSNSNYVIEQITATNTEALDGTLPYKRITPSNLKYVIDNSAIPIIMNVRNESGATLVKGALVHINGTHANGNPLVEKANNLTEVPAIGMLNADILNNANGVVVTNGEINGIDTSSASGNDVIYLNGDGGWTTTKPIGVAKIQNIGVVSRLHASNGSIEILGSGRTNDLPNLAQGNHWIGDANGVPQQTAVIDYSSDISALQATVISLQSQIDALSGGGDGVTGAVIANAGVGSGVTNGTYSADQTFSTGSGTGASFTVTVVNNAIVSIDSINTAGSGYIASETISLFVYSDGFWSTSPEAGVISVG